MGVCDGGPVGGPVEGAVPHKMSRSISVLTPVGLGLEGAEDLGVVDFRVRLTLSGRVQ